VRVQAQQAAGSWASGMMFRLGAWGSVPACHVQADGQMTVRRSLAVRLGPKNPAEQALPLSPGEFEPCPLSALSGDVCRRQPGVLPCRRPCRDENSGRAVARELHRGHPSSRQPNIRCAAQEASGCRQCPASSADQCSGRVSGLTDRPLQPIGMVTDLLFLHSPPRETCVPSVWRP
jgi:hypothetical protein